jgi:phage tail sheath gpL-like
MSSPNIMFDSVPSTIRKPGIYPEINTSLAVRSLPANDIRVVAVAQCITGTDSARLIAGTVAEKVVTKVNSDQDAALFFGPGSVAHLIAQAAFAANRYIDLSIIGVADAGGAVYATGTFTFATNATAAGILDIWIGSLKIGSIAIANADTPATIATAVAAAINAVKHLLPVTATAADAVVTVKAKNAGTVGNLIPLSYKFTGVTGTTCTIVAMASGATDPTLSGAGNALDKLFGAGFNMLISGFHDATSLTALKNFVNSVSAPIEHRPITAYFGATNLVGAQAAIQLLCGDISGTPTLNNGRFACGYMPYSANSGTQSLAYEIGAQFGAVMASESDPARPRDGMVLPDISTPALNDRLSRSTQEDLLKNGVTPLEVVSEQVTIVRAVSTYTKNASGILDPALLDITTLLALDYVQFACTQRLGLRFQRAKISSRVIKLIRSEILDVLYSLEKLEIVRDIDSWKDYVIVEIDTQDATRLNVRIPASIVPGLHVIAERIDLLSYRLAA